RQPLKFLFRGKQFATLVKEYNSKPVLFETWSDTYDPVFQHMLSSAYEELGRQTDAMIIPCGDAWLFAHDRNKELNLYSFDEHHPTEEGTYFNACLFYAFLFHKSPSGLPTNITFQVPNSKEEVPVLHLDDARAKSLQDMAWSFYQTYGNAE